MNNVNRCQVNEPSKTRSVYDDAESEAAKFESDYADLLNAADQKALLAVPTDWENLQQLALPILDMSELDSLGSVECKRRCQAVLGNIQHAYRLIRDQAQVVRDCVVKDARLGHKAMMARPVHQTGSHARMSILNAISNWHYADGQDEKETLLYMGAISGSRSTLKAVIELNKRKTEFGAWLQHLKSALGQESGKEELAKLYAVLMPEAPLNIRRKVAGNMVRELLHKRLNIRQLTRQIPVVSVNPDKISWRWSVTPSTLKIKKNELIQLLGKRNDAAAHHDLKILANEKAEVYSWRKGETYDSRISVFCATAFAKQDPLNPILKNKSLGIKSRLPVFYYADHPREQIPTFQIASDDELRYQRSTKIERDPFLISLPIHRYVADQSA